MRLSRSRICEGSRGSIPNSRSNSHGGYGSVSEGVWVSNTVAYHFEERGQMTETNGRDIWIKAGMAALADGGVDSVRVEVLAKNLGVTKGGLYRRFNDRKDLLNALLEKWSVGRVEAIEKQTQLDGITAREGLRSLIHLYAERINSEGMAVELAIRQWARLDENATLAVAKVDSARLKNVDRLYGALGLSAELARAHSFLFFRIRLRTKSHFSGTGR
jgi:AcrR family transcriptional regulator